MTDPTDHAIPYVTFSGPAVDRLDKRELFLEEILAVLEPFARAANAVSLSGALGHIERAHLRAAADAIATLRRERNPPMHDLSALQAKVRELTGPVDGVTAHGIANSLSPWGTETPEGFLLVDALRGSVDAALGLVTKLLPGSYGHVAFSTEPNEACLYYNHGEETVTAHGATPALALLAALLCCKGTGWR